MKNYMVNVVTSSLRLHRSVRLDGDNMITDMKQIILVQFGPCSIEEGEALADRINSRIRGGGSQDAAEAFRILGLNQNTGDAWASCDEIPSTGISELLEKFEVKAPL